MEKRLFRNEHDKVVAGVSSGLADYMQVDVTIIRLLFVLSSIFLAGGGLVVYIVMWIVVPVNNDPAAKFSKFDEYFKQNKDSIFGAPNTFNNPPNPGAQTKWNTENVEANKINDPIDFSKLKNKGDTSKTVVGLLLLVFGVYFLLRSMDLIPYWFSIFKIYKLWPLAIIAIGVSLIYKNQHKNEWENFSKTDNDPQKQTEETQVSETIIVEEKKDQEEANS